VVGRSRPWVERARVICLRCNVDISCYQFRMPPLDHDGKCVYGDESLERRAFLFFGSACAGPIDVVGWIRNSQTAVEKASVAMVTH